MNDGRRLHFRNVQDAPAACKMQWGVSVASPRVQSCLLSNQNLWIEIQSNRSLNNDLDDVHVGVRGSNVQWSQPVLRFCLYICALFQQELRQECKLKDDVRWVSLSQRSGGHCHMQNTVDSPHLRPPRPT